MKYATAYDEKAMARAAGIALPISMKKTVEVCSFVRGKDVAKAIRLLDMVQDEQVAIPFRKYNHGGTGHKPGSVGPGKYPKNVCTQVVKLLKQAQANAKVKGLDTGKLVIAAIVAKKAAKSWHYSRQRGRQMKRTHIELVVKEAAP